MEILLTYLKVFAVGGLICLAAQILIDRTKITPARILVGCVAIGVLLVAAGIDKPVVEWAGAGITAPIIGFGITLARGVAEAVAEKRLFGVLAGGLTATSAGICAVIFFAFLAALFSSPKAK